MLRARDFLADQQVTRREGSPLRPAVSVILPVAQQSDGGLERAITCVLGQTFDDLELIVVDDGSHDGSFEAVRAAQRQDARVVHVRHELRCDIPALRVNEGIELARAEWIGFQLEDDRWRPGALAALQARARELAEPAVVFGAAEVERQGERLTIPQVPVDFVRFTYQSRIANSAALVPRQLLEIHGGYDPHLAMRWLSDWDLWLRLSRQVPFVGVEELVSEVTVHGDLTSLGGWTTLDVRLARFLQAIPRDRLLRLDRWREYEVDGSVVGGVALPPALRDRFAREQVRPFRRRVLHALPQVAGVPVAAPAAAAPRPLLLTSDSYYHSLDLCFGYHDEAGIGRGTYKAYYQPLLHVVEWGGAADVVLLVRSITGQGSRVIEEARQVQVPTGYYLDDDLLHLGEYGAGFEPFAPGGEFHQEIERQLGAVDAVWSTSRRIDDSVRPHNPRIVPHHGAVPEASLPTRLRPRGGDGRIRIGYVGNAYRIEEFRLLWSALQAVCARWSDRVEVVFWGLDPAELPPLGVPTSTIPFELGFRRFMNKLVDARFDILLTPLLDQSRPHLAKAPSKYMLTAVAGALGIFSDVAPYDPLPAGVSCLKPANTPAAWEKALEEALAMTDERFDQMRAAMVEHVRLAYTDRAQIHLHEAAVRATEVHGAWHEKRVDGRPRVLFVCGGDAPDAAIDEVLRAALVVRDYGFEPRALCAGDAIELQRRITAMGITWNAVARALLTARPQGDASPLARFYGWEHPALLHLSSPMPAVEAAAREVGLPVVVTPPSWRTAPAQLFDDGLRRVLAGDERRWPPRVVVLGELTPGGRQLQAIEALSLLPPDRRPELVLWGATHQDPAYANRCRRRAWELGVQRQVRFRRPVEDEALPLADADLLLDLGDDEQLPPSAAHALSGGVPLLASSPGIVPGRLVDGLTAWQLDATDPVALARVLERALTDDAQMRVARDAYRWARSELHPQRAASELMKVYLGRNGARDGWHPAEATPSPATAAAAPVTSPSPPARLGRRERLREPLKRAGLYRPLSRLYWRTRRKRILVVCDAITVSEDLYYKRVLDALTAATGRVWQLALSPDVDLDDLYSFHAVLLSRTISERSLDVLRAARRQGCRVVYDTDDFLPLLAQVVPDPQNPLRRALDPAVPIIEQTIAEADAVRIYTPGAEPYVRPLNPRVVYIPPYHPEPLPLRAGAPRPLKLGFLGSLYKDEEFAPVLAALRRLLDRPELPLCVEFFGFLPQALRGDPRVAFVPWRRGYDTFRDLLAQLEWDIGLAPLRDLPFTRCKNAIKYREYGAAGIAGIYSDMPTYSTIVRSRETGLLVTHEDDRAWEAAILELLGDDALRESIRRNAAADVRASYPFAGYAAALSRFLDGPWPPPPGRVEAPPG